MKRITVVGGGYAGLVAAISCAEGGAQVRLLEAHRELGGRARSTSGPYRANLGPHVFYGDAPAWGWLNQRELLPPYRKPPVTKIRYRWEGKLHLRPPLALVRAGLALRGRPAPDELSFRDWVIRERDPEAAELLSRLAGVFSFHHDPGELAASFVWERTVRALLTLPPSARYLVGGWTPLIERLERHARALGVEMVSGERVQALPDPPAIVATELSDARALLGDESLTWLSGRTLCLDLGLERRPRDPFIVSDLDEAGWVERFTAADPSLAPAGQELIQAQMPLRPGESTEQAGARLDRLLDASLPDWEQRTRWRRRQLMDGRSGALDPPGASWRDRPAVDRGDGIFLAGDMVASPGLLSEVSWSSALEAARGALHAAGGALRPASAQAA